VGAVRALTYQNEWEGMAEGINKEILKIMHGGKKDFGISAKLKWQSPGFNFSSRTF